jgi:hypothetical protein
LGLRPLAAPSFAPSLQANAGQVTTTAQLATASVLPQLAISPQNAELQNPNCSCQPCQPAVYHRNAVRASGKYRLNVTMTINFLGSTSNCSFRYIYQYTAADGRNLEPYYFGYIYIRAWWPKAGTCGDNYSTTQQFFPSSSNTLTVTSDWHYYGACGPEDTAQTAIYVCAPAQSYPTGYGQSCYDNETYPATYPNV